MIRRTITLAALALSSCATPAPAQTPAPTQQAAALPHAFEAGWKGEKVCEPLFENDKLRAGRCTFPPGVGHERHFHRPHWGYIVTDSTMRITDASGTNVRLLKARTSWWSDGIAWHEAVNIGETTGVYIIYEPK